VKLGGSIKLSQVVGAYTGGGMSLVDLGMVPFQQAWLMICTLSESIITAGFSWLINFTPVALIFAILGGNHGMVSFPSSSSRLDLILKLANSVCFCFNLRSYC
jgi:hypothetical protein